MKRFFCLLSFLLFIASVLFPFQLKLERSYALEESDTVTLITCDRDHFYLSDWKDVCIYVYDSAFSLQGKLLRQGKGPGEVSANFFYTEVSPDGLLYVFDPMMARFNVFKGMELEDTVNLRMMLNKFVFLDEDSLIFSLIMDFDGQVLEQVNLAAGDSERKFAYKSEEKGQRMVIEGQISMLLFDGDLYFGYTFKNKLIRYSLEQDCILNETKLPFIKDAKNSDNPISSLYTLGIAELNGRILILAADYKGMKFSEGKADIYLYQYDKSLNYVDRYKFDGTVSAMCVKEGNLYAVQGGTVNCYSLKN